MRKHPIKIMVFFLVSVVSVYFLEPFAAYFLEQSGALRRATEWASTQAEMFLKLVGDARFAWPAGILLGLVIAELWKRHLSDPGRLSFLHGRYRGLSRLETSILKRLDASQRKRLLLDRSSTPPRALVDDVVIVSLPTAAEVRQWQDALARLVAQNQLTDSTGRGEVYDRVLAAT